MKFKSEICIALASAIFVVTLGRGETFRESPTQIKIDYSDKPTVYWTDKHEVLYLSASKTEFWTQMLEPWTRRVHKRLPWATNDPVLRRTQCQATSFDVSGHAAYVLGEDGTICEVLENGTTRRISDGRLFARPQSIAVIGTSLFVADPKANAIFVLSRKDGALLQRLTAEPSRMPDKLITLGRQLAGFNYSTFVLVKYDVDERSYRLGDGSAQINNPFDHASKLTSLKRPIDFSAAGSAFYFLDAGRGQIAILPIGGSRLFFLSYSGVAGQPTAIASTIDDGHVKIALADSLERTFVVIQGVTPVNLYMNSTNVSVSLPGLYEYLYHRKLLPTVPYDIQPGDTLNSIIESNHVIPFGAPDRAHSILCELNRCDTLHQLPLRSGSRILLPHLEMSFGESRECLAIGIEARQCISSSQPTLAHALSSLAIPSHFLADTQLRSFENSEREKRDALDEGSGITEKLKALNTSYAGPDILQESRGTFVVPILGVVVSALVSDQISRKDYNHLREAVGDAAIAPIRDDPSPQLIVPSNNQNGYGATLLNDKWRQMISEVDSSNVPPNLVAVVDNKFNDGHPEFYRDDGAWNLSYYVPKQPDVQHLPPPKPEHTSGPSKDVEYGSASDDDHGTFVSALIGGSNIGLYPKSELFAVNTGELSLALKDPDFKPRVINLSLGEKPGDSPNTLAMWKNDIEVAAYKNFLFVLAAGNRYTEVDDASLAASGVRTNVLVVGANTVENPSWWKKDDGSGSAHSGKYVGVIAPGVGILSAIRNGSYGYGDGTSASAAIVSSAAAVLEAQNDGWAPWRIKYRLISTSDFPSWLTPGLSFGGLLDEKMALNDTNHSVIVFHGEKSMRCVADLDPRALDGEVSVAIDREKYLFTYRHLLRLHRDPLGDSGSDTFAFFLVHVTGKEVDDPDHGIDLVKTPMFNTATLQGATTVHFTPVKENGSDCGGKTSFQLTQIDDLYNPVRSHF